MPATYNLLTFASRLLGRPALKQAMQVERAAEKAQEGSTGEVERERERERDILTVRLLHLLVSM